MLDLVRRVFAPRDPPPSLAPLVEEAQRQRERAEIVVEQVEREHRRAERRERADIARALRRTLENGGAR